jgi:hypothetical protein
MPLFNSQQQHDRGIRGLGTGATVVIELLVLLALAFAVVRYVEWSSDAAQAEFMSATVNKHRSGTPTQMTAML